MEEITLLADSLARQGFALARGVFSEALLARLRIDLDTELERYATLHRKLGYTNADQGGAHHVLASGGVFVDVLEQIAAIPWLETSLRGRLIVNSYGAFDNRADRELYVCNVHRDIRFHLSERPLMLNLLVMVDDFTLDNGATFLLPGSHTEAERPSDERFFGSAKRAVGQAGDLLVFDSRLWHAAGRNQTPASRRALTITLTNPFFKPQFDYCRALGDDVCASCSDRVKQLLGYFARVPASLEEWYQPAGRRFYRGDQDIVG